MPKTFSRKNHVQKTNEIISLNDFRVKIPILNYIKKNISETVSSEFYKKLIIKKINVIKKKLTIRVLY